MMDDAIEDIEGIQYYISYVLHEPNVSRRLICKIQDEIFDLDYMPRKYKILKKTKNKEIHQKSVKNYNIIYQIDIKIKKVYILHIFYSKRNYLKLI